jgi:hypothetical protein
MRSTKGPRPLNRALAGMRRETVTAENVFLLALFACGAFVVLLSRWAPLSSLAALAFPLLLPPLGIGLTIWFC